MLRGRESTNVEDRRGMSPGGIAIGGGGLGIIILLVYVFLCGGDPQQLTQILQQQQPAQQTQSAPGQEDDETKFVKSVLGSTEDIWQEVFSQNGRQYRPPVLVLYSGRVSSACGLNSAATGPFYCPGDEKLYLDTSFFDELKTEFKAPGDFAEAYVIAHEIGHHIQNQLGTMEKVTALQQRVGQAQANQLSVRLELQADYYAGVWAHYAQKKGQVEVGDAEEAIRAAAAVGDDMIQKKAQGYVVPEAFTHGSSKERMASFAKGYQSGDIKQGAVFFQ